MTVTFGSDVRLTKSASSGFASTVSTDFAVRDSQNVHGPYQAPASIAAWFGPTNILTSPRIGSKRRCA